MQRWDIRQHGTRCTRCCGKGSVEQQRDAHRSAGTVPCPGAYFHGHGVPVCVHGVLHFSAYDLANWCGQRGVRIKVKPRRGLRTDLSTFARRER
jgi:hypothetical protein